MAARRPLAVLTVLAATFNLPHWLAQTRPADEKGLRDLLARARPHLFAVSMNR